jgi:hypothetical protein
MPSLSKAIAPPASAYRAPAAPAYRVSPTKVSAWPGEPKLGLLVPRGSPLGPAQAYEVTAKAALASWESPPDRMEYMGRMARAVE